MIVLYDDVGRITQTFMFVAPSLEEYARTVLEPAGRKYLEYTGSDILDMYVKDGEVIERPRISLQGEVRPVTADGEDTLTFIVDRSVTIKVVANGQVVASETVTDGTIELSFDHPGSYVVVISSDFPILDEVLNLEAV